MGDVLGVPLVGAGVQIHRNHRIGVEVVARPFRAIQVGRGIADHEEDGACLQVDRRVHPHAAAQRLVERAVLRQLGLFGGDVALHVAAGGVVLGPDAFMAFFGDGVERPQQLARRRFESLDEAANAVLAAVRADQHLAVYHRGRHGFAVAFFRIGDLGFPQQLAGLGFQRHQLGIERSHEELVPFDGHAPVVGAAAEGGDGTHLVLVVPELLAGDRIQRVHVVERGGHEHHAVDHDGRRLHRLAHFHLEHEFRPQRLDVARVDLGCPDRTGSARSHHWCAASSGTVCPRRSTGLA